ncbi:hypothetical protein D8674_026264 [Pyrus ussuriensis x Pyrus communis]|uniref:RING-type E3 ubiquitin transferase n=1 Tax=Pyrus ussuriensis x Pyrus communis TaxID=2448454 RepID=A0A5N5IDD8_9ROSA|nr:hypothetical protein D8674_026264 [Pyrus ussuriensis x Pyrus communis]
MEVVYHEMSQNIYCHVDPFDTQVLDPLGHHEKYSPCVPLEICFEVSRTTASSTARSLRRRTANPGKIIDACWLETRNEYVTSYLSQVLYFLKIHEDKHSAIVETIIDRGIRIRNLDSKKGPKVLRMTVDMKRYHNWIRCEDCSKEKQLKRDALIKKTLKRDRVVAYALDVCPICLEEFVVGLKDVRSMPCTHVFHENCIWRWFERSHLNCPICRFEIFIEPGSQGEGDIRDFNMLRIVLLAVRQSTTDLHHRQNPNPQKTRYLKECCRRSSTASATMARSHKPPLTRSDPKSNGSRPTKLAHLGFPAHRTKT